MFEYYLVKNHKEFKWIQFYLFDKGFCWGDGSVVNSKLDDFSNSIVWWPSDRLYISGTNIVRLNEKTLFPKIFKVQEGFIYFTIIRYDLLDIVYTLKYCKHVSMMMRKEKIKALSN